MPCRSARLAHTEASATRLCRAGCSVPHLCAALIDDGDDKKRSATITCHTDCFLGSISKSEYDRADSGVDSEVEAMQRRRRSL